MSDVCECCGGTGRAPAEPDRVDQLAAVCRERGYWLSPDLELRTADAAELLGVTAQWLRTQACYYDEAHSRRAGRHRLWPLAELLKRLDV